MTRTKVDVYRQTRPGLINKSKAKARGLQDVEAFLKGQDDGTKVSLGRPVTAEETTSVKLLS